MKRNSIALLISVLVLAVGVDGASAGGKFSANLIAPGATVDAGIDGPVADGANDVANFPLCTASGGLTTVGACNGPVHEDKVLCDPKEPSTPPCTNACQGFAIADGITAADTPDLNAVRIIPKKSKCDLKDTTLRCTVAFEGAGDRGRDFTGVDTDGNVGTGGEAIGVCGFDGAACRSARDCTDPLGLGDDVCLSGDEYWVEAVLLVGANADGGTSDGVADHQACTSTCIASSVDNGRCEVGTCAGGARDGGACIRNGGALGLGCPGGGCDTGAPVVFDPSPADRDEVDISLAGIDARIHCPLVLPRYFPLEIRNGKGKLEADLNLLGSSVPPTVDIQVLALRVHDKAGDEGGGTHAGRIDHTLGLGAIVPPATASGFGSGCPTHTLLLNEAAFGGSLPLNVPVSPVVAVAGSINGKVRCADDGDCRGGACCGGACTTAPTCP